MFRKTRYLTLVVSSLLALGAAFGWMTLASAGPNAPTAPEKTPDTVSHTLTALNGRVYQFGGGGITTTAVKNDLWVFEPSANLWSQVSITGTLPPARKGHSAVSFNNKLLIMGGQNSNSEILGDVWSYNPATNKWEEVDQDTAPSGRTGAGAVSSQDGFIYVFGGIQNPPMSLGSLWRFDPASGQWTIMGMENPAGPRYGHYMTQIGNKIYLVGGMQCTSGNFIQSYNLSGFEFTNVTPINQGPARRMNHAGATLGNDIYIFGGTSITNSRTLSDTWKFNTVTNAWQRLPNLPQAISDFNAAVVTDTVSGRRLSFMSADEPRFLLSRGIDASGGLVETSYIFDGVNYEPVEDGFSIFLPMVMWK